MKNLKNIITVFSVAVATVIVFYGGYNIYASDGESQRFRGDLDFWAAKTMYHNEMNEYFNDKISSLNELLEDPDFFKSEYFVVPDLDPVADDFDVILRKCGEKNLSTYCVSMGALNLYTNYVFKLNKMLGAPVVPQGTNLTSTDVFYATRRANDAIHDEIEEAKHVMRATVSVYDEYKRAYPMHKKYREIINNLLKYRSVVKNISRETKSFPIKFIDATSAYCD
jgi:hypothetical protein